MLFPSVNRQKSWIFFIVFILVALNLYFNFSFQGTIEERSRWLDSLFSRVLYPVQKVFDFSEQLASEGGGKMVRLWSADQENLMLKENQTRLELQIHEFKELQAENERMRGLLNFRQNQSLNYIACRVIGRDASSFFRTLEIDRGFEDGLEPGMAVVSPEGIVGRVMRTGPRSSSVLMITDINSKIDAVVQRSRTRVIVGGSADGNLTLRFLPRRYDVRQGDEIVTSGLGGLLPPGFKVGVIVGIAQDPNLVLQQAELEPSVDFDSIEEVFAVKASTAK